jgi:hypothetical protein
LILSPVLAVAVAVIILVQVGLLLMVEGQAERVVFLEQLEQ